MKSILSNKLLILIVQIFLGGLFVVSSLDKLADPQAFANSVLQYRVIGPTLSMCTATILPPLELLCGLCLIIGLYPRGSELLITFMLIGFTILVISALMRGLDISCGCFTQDPTAGKIGYKKILENLGLMVLSIWLLVVPNQEFNFIHLFRKRTDPFR